jgi:ribosomal protein L12E/L44/L45/RPP1/RPP2
MTNEQLPATFCKFRRVLILGAALCLVASAASAQTRVAVGEVSGPGGAQVRASVVRALKAQDDVDLVGSSAISQVESRIGMDAKSGARVDVSRELGIAAWVEGQVEKSRRGVDVTLVVIHGGTGETMTVMSYEAKKPRALANLVEESVWTDLGTLIMTAQPPPPQAFRPAPSNAADQAGGPAQAAAPDEEAAEEEEEESETEDEPSQDDGDRPSPLDVGIGMVGLSRSLEYNDAVSALSTYSLDLGPSIALQAHWYPAAHFDSGPLANIGLDLRGRLMFAVDSGLDDASYPTSSRALGIGLRGRLPLDEHELAAVFGYASQTFEIDPTKTEMGEIDSGIPGTSYGLLRLGMEARLAFGVVHVGAAAAYLPVLSTGELEDWFPQASAAGLEGELSIGYALSPAFELAAAFGLQRIALSMNPELDDATSGLPIAGGAVDEMIYGTLGARFYVGR